MALSELPFSCKDNRGVVGYSQGQKPREGNGFNKMGEFYREDVEIEDEAPTVLCEVLRARLDHLKYLNQLLAALMRMEEDEFQCLYSKRTWRLVV